jgi:hypothetical protein
MKTDDPTQKALDQIVELEAKIAPLQAQIVRLKNFINTSDELSGRPPRYENVALPGTSSTANQPTPSAKRWQPGDFFNKPLATAVKAILQAKSSAAGEQPSPASVDEIHDALVQGTFKFETSGEEAQKNSIRISLGKNSVTFSRLPNSDLFGMAEWYGKKHSTVRPDTFRRRFGADKSASASSRGEAAAGDAAADDLLK